MFQPIFTFKNPSFLFTFVFFGGFIILPVCAGFMSYQQQHNLWVFPALGTFQIVGIGMLTYIWKRKVDLYQNEFVYTGLFKKKTFYYHDIESIHFDKRTNISESSSGNTKYTTSYFFVISLKNNMPFELELTHFKSFDDKCKFLQYITSRNPYIKLNKIAQSYKDGIDPGVEKNKYF